MPKILILGATGRLGGLIAKLLSQKDAELRLASSREEGRAALAARFPGSECLVADWYDTESLVRAMDGVDRLFVVTPDFYTDETVVTPNIIAAAKTNGALEQIVRLIAVPPGLTAGQLPAEMLATRCGASLHVIAKPLLDASGLPLTYINVPAWFMGMIPAFFAYEVKKNQRLALPQISNHKRMMVSETDIAELAAKILTEPAAMHVGKEYLLTNSEMVDFDDVADMLGDELGLKLEFVDDDSTLRAAMGNGFDVMMTYFKHDARTYAGVPHSEWATELLGRPQTSVRDYIRQNREKFL